MWILVLTYVDMQIVLTTISRHRHCSYVTQANGKGELKQVRTRVLELLETWQVPEDPDIRLLLPILSRTIVLEPHMMLTEGSHFYLEISSRLYFFPLSFYSLPFNKLIFNT